MDHLTLDGIWQEQDDFLVAEGEVRTVEGAQRWIERRWGEHFTRRYHLFHYLDKDIAAISIGLLTRLQPNSIELVAYKNAVGVMRLD